MPSARSLLVAVLVCTASGVRAQEVAQPAHDGNPAAIQPPSDQPPMDGRTQYPKFMENSFFTFSVGFIGYRFGERQLEPGFQAESIEKPKLSVRVDLFGHRFNKYLSAQAVYMRPAWFVQYKNINGTSTQQVSNAYAGMTLALDLPVTSKVSVYGEGGGGITSRSGVLIDGKVALAGAHYTSGMLGAGLDIVASRTLDLMLSATYVPGREAFLQPSTRVFTAGLRYHMRTVPDAAVQENRSGGYVFAENMVRVGLTTNVFSYAMNDLFSKQIPIFWGGHVEARQGFTVDYQRNVFHTKKVFAFDLGVSGSVWGTDGKGDTFATLSGYPMFRFFVVRSRTADLYVNYSLAGPTFISRSVLDNQNTGARFTFQDFMGVGTLLGSSHRFNVEIGIKHYSNGNLFTTNASVKVPLTFSIGYTF